MNTWNRFIIITLIGAITGCQSARSIFDTEARSPRDRYILDLDKGNLTHANMVSEWLRVAEPESHDSILVTLPFRETGYFSAAEPQARFYRFKAKEGQVLTLTSLIKAKEKSRLFIDLFSREDSTWKKTEHADSTLTITHEFKNSGTYLVRVQPELLINLYYSITLSVTPVLLNPVKGASNKSIGSFYGDPRDGGKRKHEGIDIFAPKGTLIVAPTDGVIQRVGTSTLGGKIVWMYDSKRSHSYYFAHMDSQMVKQGMKVRQGSTIGTVGNTGNAKNTPSHLHFGVYQKNSKDPVAYIRTMERLVNELAPDTLFESVVFRVIKKNAVLLPGPASKTGRRLPLERDAWLKIIAQSGDWFRVITSTDNEGYVLRSAVAPAKDGKRLTLQRETMLLSMPDTVAVPIGNITNTVELLARSRDFLFVKNQNGVTGWIPLSSSGLKMSDLKF